MRGKKAKMLRAAAAQEAEEIGANAKRTYRQFKSYYAKLALVKSQNPTAISARVKRKASTVQRESAAATETGLSPAIVVRPMKFIRARIKDEHTTIGNLTGGLVRYIKHAPNMLAKHQLDRLATGGRLD